MVNKKPEWLIRRLPEKESLNKMEEMLVSLSLNTVCQEAKCPNIGECFKNKTATFMILGDICTRQCKFCAVTKGEPTHPDPAEPKNVAKAVKKLGLKHTVITSVTRDDLEDGGAEHFVHTIKAVRKYNPKTSIEVLVPDFDGKENSIQKVIDAKPEIINHNLETVAALYSVVRPQAQYLRSLELLQRVKTKDSSILTKTGIMLGLGEKEEEVMGLVEDLVKIQCDILTFGQYLRPTKEHLPVQEYVTPEKFQHYKEEAEKRGIKFVESGPFVRSSYNAAKGFDTLQNQENL
ncbi:lipoyl synthase LipA [Clostridium aceticum]|uniref:Lipoyl synthase n=1 Tax=Clostridium aceticum TaxID=84022 RepID=A0A0D8ID60_9CLOT|nr:lipoyl synthase [Clostridium aceticum]AKL94545.1 lipoyl synthase LipA [Clostridium aceticum]KJF28250.1 hypothetical protein TZ02_02400 [Clostridium aceticum]